MTNRRIFALLLSVTLEAGVALGQAAGAQPPAKPAPNPFLRVLGNGAWWTSLPDDVRDTFVDGYATAMIRVNNLVASECADGMKHLGTGAKFEADWNAAMNLCVIANFLDFTVDGHVDRQKIRNAVDEFYKDSQNKAIPIDFAMEHVQEVFKGKMSAQELEDQLKDWRRKVSQ